MKNIIIGTHGHLSQEFIETAKLIAGDDIEIGYFCMTKGKSVEDAEREVRALLDVHNGKEVIVLTDVLGGSVANLFTTLLKEYDFNLLTGVNLPMVLTALLTPFSDDSSETFISEVINEARNGIQYVNELFEKEGEDDLDDLINED